MQKWPRYSKRVPTLSSDQALQNHRTEMQGLHDKHSACNTPELARQKAEAEYRSRPRVENTDGRMYKGAAEKWSEPGGGYDRAMAPWKALNSLGRRPQRPSGPPVMPRAPMTQR